MRKVLHEFFRPTKEEFEQLWKNALITFDASSLLNLYGYSAETNAQLIEAYEKFNERIILPYQFALEYSRNRANVISKQIANFQRAEKDLVELRKKNDVTQEQPYLSKQSIDAVEAILKELATGRSKMEQSMASDESSDLLLKLFDGKIGAEPSAAELSAFYVEGKERYAKRTPPGFEDMKAKGEPGCYGDFIAWKQIMAVAAERKRDFILVTDDDKEDWWHYEASRAVGPLPALRKEFRTVTGQSIWIYRTEGFLRAAKEFAEVKVPEAALNEVMAALRQEIVERADRLTKMTSTELDKLMIDKAKARSPEDETKKKTVPRREVGDAEDDEL
jgi:cell division protein FtsB